MQQQPQIWIAPLRHLRHEAPRAVGAISGLMVQPSWIATKMQESVRTPTDCSFARGAQLKECVSQTVWTFFLLRNVSTNHTILCWWVSSIILLLGAFWFKPRKIEIKPWSPASPFDTDKFKGLSLSMLELLQDPSHSDWSWLVHGFCPSSRSCMALQVAPTFQAGNGLALAYRCWKVDASWAGQWGVLLCLLAWRWLKMWSVSKRRTCLHLLLIVFAILSSIYEAAILNGHPDMHAFSSKKQRIWWLHASPKIAENYIMFIYIYIYIYYRLS